MAAYRQLAWNLGGTYRDIEGIPGQLATKGGAASFTRTFDVAFEGGLSEAKYAGDAIKELAVRKDAALIGQGFKIRYDIIPDVNTGEINPTWQLRLLEKYGIPYKIWGPDFWTLGFGQGLAQHMTWEP